MNNYKFDKAKLTKIVGRRCLIQCKNFAEKKPAPGILADFSEDGVLFAFDSGAMPLIAHDEIKSLSAAD